MKRDNACKREGRAEEGTSEREWRVEERLAASMLFRLVMAGRAGSLLMKSDRACSLIRRLEQVICSLGPEREM